MNIKKFISLVASPKLTIFCLLGAAILVLLGTLDQVTSGVYFAQKKFFKSFFVTTSIGGLQFPYFPGGYFFAVLLTLNLLGAYKLYFKFNRQKIVLFFMHSGLLIFIFGEALCGFVSNEGQMAIKVGESSNFSENMRQIELIVIDKSNPEFDQITTIEQKKLVSGKTIAMASLPFKLHIKKAYPNAKIINNNNEIVIEPLQEVKGDNQINEFIAVVDIVDKEKKLASMILSNANSRPQSIDTNFELLIRSKRMYYPFSITLTDFKREMYQGTNVPKSFSSFVKIFNEKNEFDRQTSIFMNNPLYYRGKTFYQASYGENDTVSILQVVDNPGWILPYIASGFVGIGLVLQFTLNFYRFRRKK